MNKRLICILLVFLMCFSLAPLAFGEENDEIVGREQNGTSAPGGALDPPPPTPNPNTHTQTKSKQGESTGTKKDPPPPATHKYNSTSTIKTELLGQNALEGLRFTLYFFEDAKSFSYLYDDPVEGRLYSKAVNLGNIDLVWYVDDGYFDDTVYWSKYDIYQRMGDRDATNAPYRMGSDGEDSLNNGGNYLKDQAVGTGNAASIIAGKGGRTISFDSSTLKNLQNIYNDSLSGEEKERGLNKFFIGREISGFSEEKATIFIKNLNDGMQNVLDYKNTCEIASMCLGNKGTLDSDPNKGSFIFGFYTDADGVKHNGVLKLYYEPLTAYSIETDDLSSSDEYVFTLHDLIAYSNANPNKQVTTEVQTITYELVTKNLMSGRDNAIRDMHEDILDALEDWRDKAAADSANWNKQSDLYWEVYNNTFDQLIKQQAEAARARSDEFRDLYIKYANKYIELKGQEFKVWDIDAVSNYNPNSEVAYSNSFDKFNITHDFNGDGKPDYKKVGDPVVSYQTKDFSEAFNSIYYYMANYTYLIAPEPTLRMTGAGLGPWYKNGVVKSDNVNLKFNRETKKLSLEQSYSNNNPEYYTYKTMSESNRTAQSSTAGKMFNSMGIGVVTSLNGRKRSITILSQTKCPAFEPGT